MSEETVIALVGLLCFALGFLLRGELQRLRKQKKEAQSKNDNHT